MFSFWPDVFTFRPNVFTFRPNVFSFDGQVFSAEVERGERSGVSEVGEARSGGVRGRGGRLRLDESGRWVPAADAGMTEGSGDVSTLAGRCVHF